MTNNSAPAVNVSSVFKQRLFNSSDLDYCESTCAVFEVTVDDTLRLASGLEAVFATLAVGDDALIFVRYDNDNLTRDKLSCAAFIAGFETRYIWTSRKQLLDECNRSSMWKLILSNQALGASPSASRRALSHCLNGEFNWVIYCNKSNALPPNSRDLLVSIIMPVYNEKNTFLDTFEKVYSKTIDNCRFEYIIVESNSTDGTRDDVKKIAQRPSVKVIYQEAPKGKGFAVREGLRISQGDIILIQDADLEYDVDDYPKIISPVAAGALSFVLGSRHVEGKAGWDLRHFDDAKNLSKFLNFGHILFTYIFNATFLATLNDPFTMYKVFRRDCIYDMDFECDRFDFDHELVGKLIRKGYYPAEIPVNYMSRSFGDGKKVAIFGDPPTWIKACLKHRFSRLHSLGDTQPRAGGF